MSRHFKHDNARPHVAGVCKDLLAIHNIYPLDWPPYYPDVYQEDKGTYEYPLHARTTKDSIVERVEQYPHDEKYLVGLCL